MKKVKWVAMLLVVILCAATLAGCGKSGGDLLGRIKEKGVIVMATSADYAPYEFIIEQNGERTFVGMDIMVAEEIAKDIGVKLEIQDMDFDGITAAVRAGTADFALAALTPNEERKKAVDFSDTYFNSEQAVMVRLEDKDVLTSVDALKDKKVGAQLGTVQEEMVTDQIAPAGTLFIAKIPNLLMELKNGNIDALVLEAVVAESAVQVHDDLFVTEIKVEDEVASNAAAVPKENPELLKSINDTIKRLQDEGKIAEFANAAAELMGDEEILDKEMPPATDLAE